MHIAVDQDDVVLDLMGGVRKVIKTEYGIDLPVFDKWEINEYLRPVLGKGWMSWMRDKAWLWATFDAVEGAIGSLDVLRRRGHYLELVTSKPDWAEAHVYQWLGKWRAPFKRVTIVGPEDKKCDFTAADVLIDDKPQNIEDFVATGRRAILFNAPHNKSHKGVPGARRAEGWQEVLDIIEEFDNGR